MIPSFEQRHSLGGRACPQFGGDSSSASTTSATTNNTDKRQVLDNGAFGVSADGGSNVSLTLNSSDMGAIAAGVGLANTVVSSNSTNFDHLLAAGESLFSKTQGIIDANTKLTGQLASTAQTAYADAANQASGNKSLVLTAIVVVGVVAFVAFGKK